MIFRVHRAGSAVRAGVPRQTDRHRHTQRVRNFIHKSQISSLQTECEQRAYQTDIGLHTASQPSVPRQTCLAYDCRNAARWETAYTA